MKHGKRVPVKLLPRAKKHLVNDCANFHRSGSITGMKNKFYGTGALLVRCGSYIYNVTDKPNIYHNEAR